MSNHSIIVPSKPKVIREEASSGVYEIDGLYPGYGHTLGNSLRRIILSSLPGAAVTRVKIKGVEHEFSSVDGVKEDVISILLNLKRLRVRLITDEPQIITLKAKGVKTITAKDITVPGQVEILNSDLHIATLTDKSSDLDIEIIVEKGLGYVSKDVLTKDRVDIGTISLDATFTPIIKANYEVENMRVGDRTNFNRLRISIETDGTLTPKEALENSISLMIMQLKAIVGFKEEEIVINEKEKADSDKTPSEPKQEMDVEFLKTRIDAIGFSPRTAKALAGANIRTIGGLARKKEIDILDIEGLGSKGIQEIKKVLSQYNITLK
ncbi:MAG: DNA-directed RNA polymerase subunit alpha [Candidatus Taylorbacteria bacterium]|nr:DNA-directed RNA polymerase subunit alpha [Candidatus Taylorbacteria bacterium]